MSADRSNIAASIVAAQDDNDTVVLPNSCTGQLVKLADDSTIRCFSIVTREPHLVPQKSWSIVTMPTTMPDVPKMDVLLDKLMIDHVTRGVIGDSALQVIATEDGNISAIRLLPPNGGSAQKYWNREAKLRLHI